MSDENNFLSISEKQFRVYQMKKIKYEEIVWRSI